MITNQLCGKVILYLSARTFNLENQIKSKLESLGAIVHFYDERLKDSNLSKAIIRVNKNILKTRIEKYYRSILATFKNNTVDYLFVVRGEVVPEFFLKHFKKDHPDCTFIFYNWDSFINTPNTSTLLHLYDKAFSFDPQDAKQYNISFRPLYYIDDYKNIKTSQSQKYDVLFLGTAHSDRYIISTKVKDFVEKHGKTMFCYYFMHSKWVYYFKKFFDNTFQYMDVKRLSFRSLSLNEILKLYGESRVILDINHPNQKGLTMRTFEAIGAKKKLITTNAEIAKFSFYNKENIFILDRNNFNLDISFFESSYQDIPEDIYKKLSIDGWLYNLFVEEEKEFWNQFI